MKRKHKKGKAIAPFDTILAEKDTERIIKKALLQARKLEIDIEKSYERAEGFLLETRKRLSEIGILDSNSIIYLEYAYITALAVFNEEEPDIDLEVVFKNNERNKNMIKLLRDSIVEVMRYFEHESSVLGIYDADDVEDIFEAFKCVVYNSCDEDDIEFGLLFMDKMIENLQNVLQAEKWRG